MHSHIRMSTARRIRPRGLPTFGAGKMPPAPALVLLRLVALGLPSPPALVDGGNTKLPLVFNFTSCELQRLPLPLLPLLLQLQRCH